MISTVTKFQSSREPPQQQFDATMSLWTKISDECFQYQKIGSYKGERASNNNVNIKAHH